MKVCKGCPIRKPTNAEHECKEADTSKEECELLAEHQEEDCC